MKPLRTLAALAALLVASFASADEFHPSPNGKKLISYGADWPNTVYLRQHVRDMETHPFDGVVIGVSQSRQPEISGATLGITCWTGKKFDAKDYEPAIDDLKATKFEKFTDNFIQAETMPGDVDWFDPQWDAIIHNFRILARIARQGGCVGLEFDPEEYGDAHIFTWTAWPESKRQGRSEQQYIEKARQRGEELMRGINAEFPGIKILCLFGPSLTANSLRSGGHDYRLLAPFLEGMCRAADKGTEIIDGYEQSYGYRTQIAFEDGRKTILAGREAFEDKKAFDRVMRVGFGLWTDNGSGSRGWFPDEPDKNHFTPETWQNAVYGALSHSDRYVWVWREKLRVWEGKNVSPAYEAAQAAGRTAPAKVTVKQKPLTDAMKNKYFAAGPRDDQSTFGDLLKINDVLVDLSTPGWVFKPDPDNEGVDQKWFAPAADASDWSAIEVGKFWEEQGWDYDGYGWYRRAFDVPAAPDRPVKLAFGACDEGALIWLNGEQIGTHGDGEYGWDKRFLIDISTRLHKGRNDLAVRVIDRTGPGGLWKGIKILTPVRGADFSPSTAGKKLIEYGWDCPETAFVRQHIREMEKRPFNGVVIRAAFPATQPGRRSPSLGWRVFGKQKFQPADYQHVIDDLKATRFEKFTDNFIQVITQPGDTDWFDPEWDSALDNIKAMARIAREGGCAGLMLDPEEYGKNKIWTWAQIPESTRAGRTLEQYQQKVRERGEQFIRAINGEFPNVKILCLFGPALTFGQQRSNRPAYSLLAPFIEGMSSGADAGTQITDGYEQSYMYHTRTSFAEARGEILQSRMTFADHDAFNRVMRVGFGLWIDNGSNVRPWSTSDFDKNYFTPAAWQSAVHYGLSYSDEYVWVYSQAFNWWTGKDLVEAYEDVQRDGRETPGRGEVRKTEPTPEQRKWIPSAASRQKDKRIDDIIATRDVLLDLARSPWIFRPDPDNVGEEKGWFNFDLVSDGWSPIEIGKFWEEQGWDYDGYGWYRGTFTAPAAPHAKRIELLIGAADESATIWLNGEKLAVHDIGENGWDEPFTLILNGHLKPGSNVLAVKILDRAGPGGLWRGLKIVVEK